MLVSNALSTAEVQRVNVDLERKKLDVILTEENMSKAIGRRGQNVRLATKLLNFDRCHCHTIGTAVGKLVHGVQQHIYGIIFNRISL